MADRRYTFSGCECGDAFCAGCQDAEPMPPPRDGEHAIRRWYHLDRQRKERSNVR